MLSKALESTHEAVEDDLDDGVMYDTEDPTTADTDFDDGFTQPIAHYYESQSDLEDGITQEAQSPAQTLHDSSKSSVSYRPLSLISDSTTTEESTIAHQGSICSSPQASASSDAEDADEEQEEDYPIGSDNEDDQEYMHQSLTSDPVRRLFNPRDKLESRYTPMSRLENVKVADESKAPIREVTGFRPASVVLKEMNQSASSSGQF